METPKRVYWHRNQWHYRPTLAERERGLKAWEPLGTDLGKARDKLRRLRLIEQEEDSTDTFVWLANWYMTKVAPDRLSKRTIGDRMGCLRQLFKTFANRKY
ncbi:MAG: hypothetical protein CMD66_01525 [Gammaproteobacteria bacterium]|nr:hypothetical protein [Gammaproteobacteria bacterium]